LAEFVCRDIYRGDTLSLQVLDRDGARVCAHQEPYAIISITDPQAAHPTLIRSDFRRDVLRLKFFDTDSRVAQIRVPPPHMTGFTPDMARQIVQFVQEQRARDTHLIVVHCEFGMSRSAGVASALSFFYNQDETFFLVHYQPNSWVRRLLMDALRNAELEV
jgi:predicted protein tyrosine phosphatase